MLFILMSLWSVTGCAGVVIFRWANEQQVEMVHLLMGIIMGPVLVILWSLDAFRERMGWFSW